ncbi:MAG: CtsR family transcriptional regulator [Clostridia bacterium]|nr:CtsR family transcriptional regulator [Clostridia bacterium]
MNNKTISDIIEEFIMTSLDDDQFIELSRNDLAKFFSCVPSQINYVLNTRFTLNRGYMVESQRGGGGYIKVTKVQDTNNNFLTNALQVCAKPITYLQASQMLENMKTRKLLSEREMELIKSAISPKSLNSPINIDNNLRSNIMAQVIIKTMQLKDRENL